MGKSPLALYLLALFRESSPELGPWRVQDDPEDLFQVVLSCPTRTFSVRVSPKMSYIGTRVEASPDGEWADDVREVVRSFLSDAFSVADHQAEWRRKGKGAPETPLPADGRES